jgi:hypothetical protein
MYKKEGAHCCAPPGVLHRFSGGVKLDHLLPCAKKNYIAVKKLH